jgi:hypothetical protein
MTQCYACGKRLFPWRSRVIVLLGAGRVGEPTPPTWEVPIGTCCAKRVPGKAGRMTYRAPSVIGGAEVSYQRFERFGKHEKAS